MSKYCGRLILCSLTCLSLIAGNLGTSRGEEPSDRKAPPTAEDYDDFVQESDRDHWAFKPVVRPAIPDIKDRDWVRNPIDAFVLAKLEADNWRPNAAGSPQQLLRRIYLDVIGLPPDLQQQAEIAEHSREIPQQQWELLIDQLLANPAYGERWGRHWLDFARYAETNGYERDGTKPHVWRYRDYVIQAFNVDKPYNRFILEQLAGDELPDASSETIIATGFHRLGPWDDEPADPKEDRFDQLDDMINTTSQVFMGITLSCARCHNHKFEPLSTLDYYRMAAIFNTLQRPQSGRDDLDLPAGNADQLQKLADRDRSIQEAQREAERLRGEFRQDFLVQGRSQLSTEALTALKVEADKRTPAQQQLARDAEPALQTELEQAFPPELKQRLQELVGQQHALRHQVPDLPRGYFFTEVAGQIPVTHVLLRGKSTAPGCVAEPGFPKVLVDAQPEFPNMGEPNMAGRTSQRRLTLAHWLASPNHPLTARVMVNRIWQLHFGEGLVRTPSDFGIMGYPPTHPELLDWLADWFVTEGQWSIKSLHRLILSSNTYQMSKAWNDEYGASDPTDEKLWRMPYRRLEVEPLCDAMLQASGQLDRQMGGPSMYPFVPRQALEGHSDPNAIWKPFDERSASRRTVYAFIKRSMVVPLLEVLDLCDTTRSSAQRNVTSVAPQALSLLNGDFANRQAEHFARRLEQEAGPDRDAQIELAWRLALCRKPTPLERQTMFNFLQESASSLKQSDSVTSDGQVASEGQAAEHCPSDEDVAHRALVQMCRAIFNLNEFAYTD